eukprot:515104_1
METVSQEPIWLSIFNPLSTTISCNNQLQPMAGAANASNMALNIQRTVHNNQLQPMNPWRAPQTHPICLSIFNNTTYSTATTATTHCPQQLECALQSK